MGLSNLPPGVSNADIERQAGAFEDRAADLAFVRRAKVGPAPCSAAEILARGAETYRERNSVYADNYKHFGHIMQGFFPRGLPATMGVGDWNRLALLMNAAAKLQRYAMTLSSGGHLDSAHDAMVYSAMLEELTRA